MKKIKNYILLILLGGISVYGQQRELKKVRTRPRPAAPAAPQKPKTPTTPQNPKPQNPLAADPAAQEEPTPPGKVGINTANPKRSLDVEGTIAVRDLPAMENGAIPLSLASDDKQVISSIDEANDDSKPFRVVNYKLVVDTAGEDWIDGVSLKINSKDYTAFIMSSSLVDEENKDAKGHPSSVFLNVLGVDQKQGYGQPLYVGEEKNRGRIQLVTPKGSVYGSDYYYGRIGIGAKQVYLYPNSKTNTWMLYADYPVSRGLNFNYDSSKEKVDYPQGGKNSGKALKYNTKYTWYLSVLVVKNSWIDRKDQDIKLKNNSDSVPMVAPNVLR